jgi:hypothetical protein
VHENEIGGAEFMTLDHFRPKDKYMLLRHEPTNLLWSCHKCNDFKKNLWPAYGTPHTVINGRGFIDPFVENLNDYFEVLPDGQLKALKEPAAFIIKNLKLNRTGAKRVREKRKLKYERKQVFEEYHTNAILEIDNFLVDTTLTEIKRKKLLQHKQDLEEKYRTLVREMELDFNLY